MNELLTQPFVLTWSDQRLSRLILPDREIYLWSESVLGYSDGYMRVYPKSYESAVEISEAEAKEIMIEWLLRGPFNPRHREFDRLPHSVRLKIREFTPVY